MTYHLCTVFNLMGYRSKRFSKSIYSVAQRFWDQDSDLEMELYFDVLCVFSFISTGGAIHNKYMLNNTVFYCNILPRTNKRKQHVLLKS